MASDAPITKRLIISGLTPSITAEDISRRLATFGTVKAADGFGLLNGVGQPRKYGYVTLETTVGKLAKCMNLLSGSTWKGAKLRFGEAKPDFRERIALENKKAAEEPPKKKRKRYVSAVHTEDMSLVTPENAAQRPGWKVSPLGRITRPVKMRPAHPLVEPQEEKKMLRKIPVGGKQVEKKKKKRVKDPDTRARRRVIDMTKYGSTHLKGMFLDLEVTVPTKKKDGVRVEDEEGPSSSSESEEEEGERPSETVQPLSKVPPRPSSPLVVQPIQPMAGSSKLQSDPSSPSAPPSKTPPTKLPSTTSTSELASDIHQEKLQSLNLLESLFENRTDADDDWAGRESVDSDIDVDELTKGDVMLVDADDEPGFEVVPKEGTAGVKAKKCGQSTTIRAATEKEGNRMDVDQPQPQPQPPKAKENAALATAQKATLKDLFAPREEEGGFSLLGHLDPDIELDEDLPFLTEQPTLESTQQKEATAVSPIPTHVPAAPIILQTHPSTSQAPLILDPKRPLFFPIQERTNLNKARQRDVFDLIKDNGWNWRDPNVGFLRSSAPNAEEEIKKRWEEAKGELTRDWKRRHREAGKVSRRKRGGVEEGEF